jgi:DNA-binding NarL/FixJ family response regulator
VAEKLAANLNQASQSAPHEALSDREYEVMCMIAKGKAPWQIAKILSLSVKTVSTYRSRVLEKLQLTTNADLTYYAIKNGLVE